MFINRIIPIIILSFLVGNCPEEHTEYYNQCYNNNDIETFQIILYDNTSLTPTGDNEIKTSEFA